MRTGAQRILEQYTRFAGARWRYGVTACTWAGPAGPATTGSRRPTSWCMRQGPTGGSSSKRPSTKTIRRRLSSARGTLLRRRRRRVRRGGREVDRVDHRPEPGRFRPAVQRILRARGAHREPVAVGFRGRSAAELRASLEELYTMVGSARTWYSAVCWLSPTCALFREQREAIGRDDEHYAWAQLYVIEFRDGRVTSACSSRSMMRRPRSPTPRSGCARPPVDCRLRIWPLGRGTRGNGC